MTKLHGYRQELVDLCSGKGIPLVLSVSDCGGHGIRKERWKAYRRTPEGLSYQDRDRWFLRSTLPRVLHADLLRARKEGERGIGCREEVIKHVGHLLEIDELYETCSSYRLFLVSFSE